MLKQDLALQSVSWTQEDEEEVDEHEDEHTNSKCNLSSVYGLVRSVRLVGEGVV